MLTPSKRYTMRVRNISNVNPGASVVVTANSVSGAVEAFLQDYLKNRQLKVEIVEDNYIRRSI